MARKRISKQTLERCIKEGMGVCEIAQALGASKSTISERVKNLLKEKLHKEAVLNESREDAFSFAEIDLELSNFPTEVE